jgi:hypothetical protein
MPVINFSVGAAAGQRRPTCPPTTAISRGEDLVRGRLEDGFRHVRCHIKVTGCRKTFYVSHQTQGPAFEFLPGALGT